MAIENKKHIKLGRSALVVGGVLILAALAIVLYWKASSKSQLPDLHFPAYDEVLSPKVSRYLTDNARGVLRNNQYDVHGNLTVGQSEDYCDVLIYGYDEQYIYAYAMCQEYGWSYHYRTDPDREDTLRITRSLIQGTGWASHVRLEYRPESDFEIIEYDTPHSGSIYYEDLQKMFAPMGQVGLHDDQRAHGRLLEKFQSDHADDPYPSQIKGFDAYPRIVMGEEK